MPDRARLPVAPLPSRSPRIGVALGGGSARGYAHIGALAALERHGLAPTVIAGTSFGAVVAALYATGIGTETLADRAEELRRRDVFPAVADFGLHRGALFQGRRLEAYFERLVEGRAFEDLALPVAVVATDADTGERVVLRAGPLAPALRASASLPGVFAPVEIDGRRLIDGGLGSPVPLRTLDAFELDLALGIGAGADADDSGTVRWVRRALRSRVGAAVHGAMGRGGQGTFGGLVRAVSWAAEGWLAEPGEGLQVHTRPAIHWLRFDRAGRAIRAGDAALERAAPQLRSALALAIRDADRATRSDAERREAAAPPRPAGAPT